MPQNTISKWLNRQVDHASTKNLRLIAPVLDLTYEDLLRRMGEIPDSVEAQVTARRQAVRDQLDRWLNAVGPEYEEVFWAQLKSHGDSTVGLIQQIQTAVNAGGDAAVNAAVSARATRGRTRRKPTDGPLTIGQHRVSGALADVRAPRNQPQKT